jgi:hypothetical protein
MALGLARSLNYCGDNTPRAIVTDIKGLDWSRYFDYVLPVERPLDQVFFGKLDLLNRTDADAVLWIDSDCLTFRPLDEVFEYCRGLDFAVPGFCVSQGEYYGKVPDILARHNLSDIPKVTAGLIYYERTDAAKSLIDQVDRYGSTFDSLGFTRRSKSLIPDEPAIALAMAKTGIGSLIPESTQFIHSAAGLVGKLWLDVRRSKCEYTCNQEQIGFFRPAIFHAWRYKDYLVYWRQLKDLQRLEKYSDTHGSMHLPITSRWSRSIQRRILKIRGVI